MGTNPQSEATETARRAVELLREGMNQREAAEVIGVSQPAISQALSKLTMPKTAADQDAIDIMRADLLLEYRQLQSDANDQSISKARRIELRLSIADRIAKLCGTDAPTRSISAHVSTSQLDPLYLDIRVILQQLEDADQQEALTLMRNFAASKRKGVIDGTHTDLS